MISQASPHSVLHITRIFYLVIPTYNRAKMVLRAIESAVTAFKTYLATANGTLHIIVVDDGSTDETSVVLSNFASGNRQICIHCLTQNNNGAGAARNRALDHIFRWREPAGPHTYLSFLDSDDILSPYYFSAFLPYENPNTIYAYKEAIFVDSEPEFCALAQSKGKTRFFTRTKAIREMLCRTRGVVNTIYPLLFWQNIRFPPTTFYEDVSAFAFVCEQAKDVVYLPITGYGIFTGNESIVRRRMDDEYYKQRIESATNLWHLAVRLSYPSRRYYRSFFAEVALHFLVRLSKNGYATLGDSARRFFARGKILISGFGRPRSFAKSFIFLLTGRRLYYSLFSKSSHDP